MWCSTQNKTLTVFLSEILDTKQDTYWFLIWDTQHKTRHLLVFDLRYSTQDKTLTVFFIWDTQHKTRHLLVFDLRYSTQNKTLTGFLSEIPNNKQDTYWLVIWDTTVSRDSFSAVRIFISSLKFSDSSLCCCCNSLYLSCILWDTQHKTRHLLVFYLRYPTTNKTLTG